MDYEVKGDKNAYKNVVSSWLERDRDKALKTFRESVQRLGKLGIKPKDIVHEANNILKKHAPTQSL